MDQKHEWTHPEPMWREDTSLPSFNALSEDTTTDVVIVGGGITGITTAYLLAKAGKQVVLLEADQILNGTTGHTTAKVTAQHGLIYDEFINHFGSENASLYYQAQMSAFSMMEEIIEKHNISCNWTEEDAYLFATTEEGAQKIDNEYQAYQELNIPGELTDSLSFDIDATKALSMSKQARFHPLKYLAELVEQFIKLGGVIYEDTKAVKVKEGKHIEVQTGSDHTVTCEQLISCSHFPFYDKGFYFSRMHPERSYVIAFEPEQDLPDGMYLSIDQPTRSVRRAEYNGKPVLLVIGENHKTGHGKDTAFHYKALEEFAATTFGIKEKLFQWSTQDLTTLDKIPYIGPMNNGNDRIFVATGFRKWGMTNSTLAAQLLSDYVMGEESLFHPLFTPSRFKADPSFKQFLSQNLDVAARLVEGKVELVEDRPKDLRNGEGAVIQWQGERAGAYRDDNGKLHLLDTTCRHMGCEVEWNSGDHTWDCPCHGSRYTYDGSVVEGPAKQPLKKIAYQYTDGEHIIHHAELPEDHEQDHL